MLFGRDGYVCFEFPTLPQGFLWQSSSFSQSLL